MFSEPRMSENTMSGIRLKIYELRGLEIKSMFVRCGIILIDLLACDYYNI